MNSVIYKYFPPSRIDVLRNLKIRLSQPPILNDPFENLYLFDLKPKDMSSDVERSDGTGLPGTKRQLFKTLASMLNQATNDAIGSGFGIISFSRTELSLLLWAHYARDYTGFALGFDAASSFFNSKIKGLTRQLQDVIYTSKRTEFNLDSLRIPNGFLCTKPVEWAYEEEVRFIDSIEESEKSSPKDELGFPIVLRSIPGDAIKEVIVGPHSTFESEILKIVEERGLATTVSRLILDEESYRLRKSEIN